MSIQKFDGKSFSFPVILIILHLENTSSFCSSLDPINIISFLNLGSMRGYLRKKGKEDNSWNLRLFVLSADQNSLSYFIKDQVCDFYNNYCA